MKSESRLLVQNLGKTFTTRNGPFRALENINLEVHPGEFVALMGHSGCGKSTLLNIIAGLDTATDGAVLLDGGPIRGPGPDRMMVFQNYSLLPWMNVYKNVLLALRSCRPDLDRKTQESEARRYIEMVGLSQAIHRLPRELSGGMKQRASIARALAVNPRVLLLDEPFGALDALTREELQDELLAIWEENNTTVIMITHDADEAILLSDRIIMMTNGPAAGVGREFPVPLQRPRDRASLLEDPAFYTLRNQLIAYLFGKEDDFSQGGDFDNTLFGAEAYTGEAPLEPAAFAET
ncbi:MAG: ABC transporter ATP-binding protein [Verrucomicrobia bacterium]|nr:ABC transporter ATP-binding protein [Verrucomicrobiota bacterium]MCH8528048.1 ABC transporter ATP-binding protein [Kiritimatiellia bacterium]